MSSDYWHKDTLRLEERLTGLRQEQNCAEQEAQHARRLHLDMKGPIEAAEAKVQRLAAQVGHVECLVERVQAGFPYLEKGTFKIAVDATGEVSIWEVISEAPVPGTIVGHDDAIIRLPVEVQKSYARAASSHLFERFEVCTCVEPCDEIGEEPPEDTIRHFLFGAIQSPNSEDEDSAIFLIAEW